MVVMVLMLLFKQSFQLIIKSILLCHRISQLLACELVPLGGNDGCRRVQLTEPCNYLIQLILCKTCGMAEYKAACIGYLVVEELAEVLLIHSALLGINYCGEAVKLHIVCVDVLYSLDNVAELTNARWLDKDTVGLVLFKHLHQSLSEIADQ